MKKSYVYFLPPIILIAIFGAIYWNFHKGYVAHAEEVAAAKEAARKKKIDDTNNATNAALAKAMKDVEIAKARRDADEAKKVKEAEDYEAALQARLKATTEAHDAVENATRLKGEVEAIEKELETLALNKKAAEAEQAHMRDLVKQALANVDTKNAELKTVQDVQEKWQKKISDLMRAAAQQQKK